MSSFEPMKEEDMKVMKGGGGDASEFTHLITNEFIEDMRGDFGYDDIPLPHPYEVADRELAAVLGNRGRDRDDDDSNSADGQYDERLLQVRRVAKTVKGGRQVSFRAVVVIGDGSGSVGVGIGKAKEVVEAVAKAQKSAYRNMITFPLDKNGSFPHRVNGRSNAAEVMLRPAGQGTGVIAGGAVRQVLEAAGVRNGFGKQLGSKVNIENHQYDYCC